jgi:L-arabinonolactonase
MELLDIIPVSNTLGEGVQWDVADQALWWTDIAERKIFRRRDGALQTFAMPQRVGSFALVEGGDEIVVAFESGIALIDLNGQEPRWLGRPDMALDGMRFNDGRVDRQGRFWAGTMEELEPRSGQGNLYCLDRGGLLHHRESGVEIANGLAWSPDGRVMYFADSPLRTIFAYDFDTETGDISSRRVFARTPDGAYPDGATVDEQGFLWSAHWGTGRVVRYAPDGRIDRALELPVSQPTCTAFGGAGLDILFVTSARDGLSRSSLAAEPNAGDVFAYRTGFRGLPERRWTPDASLQLPPQHCI